MARVIEAIYENGMLKLLEKLDLAEHQHVKITIHESLEEDRDEALEAWTQVYDGCAEDEITKIEEISLDRSRFMRQEPK